MEYILKRLNFFVSIIASGLLLFGCQSTSNEVAKVVKYKSYCSTEIKEREEFTNNTPIVRVSPKLPRDAIKNRTPGYVKMEFDIDSDGKPVNINIVESMPGDLFHKVSLDALSKWRYKPSTKKCKSIQLDFKFA